MHFFYFLKNVFENFRKFSGIGGLSLGTPHEPEGGGDPSNDPPRDHPDRKSMEADMWPISHTIRPRILTRTQRVAGLRTMIGITDSFAFSCMPQRRAKSLALR